MACEKVKKLIDDDNSETKKSSTGKGCQSCMLQDRNDSSKSHSFDGSSSRSASCSIKCPAKVLHSESSSSHSSKSAGGSSHHESPSSKNVGCERKELRVTNPFIEKMDEDILYHIALGNKSHDLPKMFGDVKFVVMGGTPRRMEQFAYYVSSQIGYELPAGTILNDISKNSHRYAMFKVGPILSVSHGMGTPSIGILLHEVIKLVSHAGIKDPIFIRIGTCGGFSKKAGTVVVSNKIVNDYMEPFYELAILGKKVRFPANLNQNVVNDILGCAEPDDKFETIAGVTYCTDNFYEGSGRADGAICEFSENEGLNYYKELQKHGVVNVEMESLAFAALTCRAGIKSAIITVILSDRLQTEQIKQPKEVLDEWQTRPQKLLARYIKGNLPGVKFDHISTKTSNKLPETSSVGSVCQPCLNLSGKVSASSSSTCKPCNNKSTKSSSVSTSSSGSSSVCLPCLDMSGKTLEGGSNEIHKQTQSPTTSQTLTNSCEKLQTEKETVSKYTTEKSHLSSSGQPCKATAGQTSSHKTSKFSTAKTESTSFCKQFLEPSKASTGTLKHGEVKSQSYFEKSSSTQQPLKCVPFKCHSETRSDTPSTATPSKSVPPKCNSETRSDTPSATTPRTYQAKDFDSSSKSTLSNDSWRSCYQKCLKMPGSNASSSPQASSASQSTTASSTWKPNIFATPEQDKGKGFPIYQLGPCCNKDSRVVPEEIPKKFGTCCKGKEVSPSSPNTTLEQQKYLEERKNQEETTGSAPKKKPVSDSTTARPAGAPVRKASNMPGLSVRELDPSEQRLGPCCDPTSQPVVPREVAPRPGPLCLGLCQEDDSPECDSRDTKSNQSESSEPHSDDSEHDPLHDINNHEYPHDHLNKDDHYDDTTTTMKPDCSKPNNGKCETTKCGQSEDKGLKKNGCPLSIPQCKCVAASSPSLKLDTSNFTHEQKTPIPSPDTPDPSTAKSLPAFVTPTPPLFKGSQCCAKFSATSSKTVSESIGKDANKYDESPSPCAACKKYQESKKQNAGSTPSDSQPEIIKCPHKLKRLKEECQGYD